MGIVKKWVMIENFTKAVEDLLICSNYEDCGFLYPWSFLLSSFTRRKTMSN